MRASEPNHNWNETGRDAMHITWRCRGCRAGAVTPVSGIQHPGKCFRCEARSKTK
jgi:hypothetical protein